jgi:hypothetical protein
MGFLAQLGLAAIGLVVLVGIICLTYLMVRALWKVALILIGGVVGCVAVAMLLAAAVVYVPYFGDACGCLFAFALTTVLLYFYVYLPVRHFQLRKAVAQ